MGITPEPFADAARSHETTRRFRESGEKALGWGYRKSVKVGPFRIDLSPRGIGHSFGGRGFHVSRTPDGRTYVTVNLPGGFHVGKAIGPSSRRRHHHY
ncbi:DUF4236 domain-containing protein [Streptosporangium sp. NPDC049046]|uniref:DUF4236 domain-containing protein n=1 Tax=Streptosporangium sp. NPDC049046 TaxID=3155031 RepID=UPI00344611FF